MTTTTASPLPPATADAGPPLAAAQAPPHGTCENCAAPLHGHFCHACGQSAHNPVKHLGHAIEEVFESFWHLDGRIVRTLRDLMVPGRVAANYLRGQRVRYVQPLRLFVILTLFTFFVGKLTLHIDDLDLTINAPAGNATPALSSFAQASTVAEVERLRDETLRDLPASDSGIPAADRALQAARARIVRQADARIAELAGAQAEGAAAEDAQAPAASGSRSRQRPGSGFEFNANGRPWDPRTNPVRFEAAPGFVNAWINRRLGNMRANIERMGSDRNLYLEAFLAALPGALFMLMPVFALVLRLAYAGRGIGYLAHMVVALYSHAWLMLALLATMLVTAATSAMASPFLSGAGHWFMLLLWWIGVPAYLLLMQARVYGGRRWTLLTRYAFIGGIYFWLVLLVAMYAILASVSS